MTLAVILAAVLGIGLLGCRKMAGNASDPGTNETSQATEATEPESTEEKTEETPEEDFTEGFGDTFSGDTKAPEGGEDNGEEEKEPVTDVDLIFFMGQSNMSGAGGDATLCPQVSEDAGQEFRAVSDPTRLYPIT